MSTSVLYRAAFAAVASGLMAGSAMAASTPWWSPYATDASTLGLWHFDDVTGSTGAFADSSGHGNNGALNGNAGGVSGLTLTVPAVSGAGTGPGAGLFGTALDYDETKNAAVAAAGGDTNTPFNWGQVSNGGGGLNYTNAVTLEAWIKPTANDLGRETYIAGSLLGNFGFNFGIDGGRMFADMISPTSGVGYKYAQQPTVTLQADTWAHVAVVLTNNGTTTTDTIYMNGAQVGTNSWADSAGVPIAPASLLNIGDNGSNPKYVMFRSQIDEVRLSNVAREFGAAPVPEPASLSLLALGGLFALRRRRA